MALARAAVPAQVATWRRSVRAAFTTVLSRSRGSGFGHIRKTHFAGRAHIPHGCWCERERRGAIPNLLMKAFYKRPFSRKNKCTPLPPQGLKWTAGV